MTAKWFPALLESLDFLSYSQHLAASPSILPNTATLRSEINIIHADLSKTDSEFASKIAEISARQSLGFSRLDRLEMSARELEIKGARRDAWEQQIKDLQSVINELRKSQAACEEAVREHENATKDMMQNAPIGRKRSDLVLPWKPQL